MLTRSRIWLSCAGQRRRVNVRVPRREDAGAYIVMTRLATLSQLAYIRWVPKASRHEAPCRLPCILPGNAALPSPPPYASSSKRSPTQPLVQIPYTLSEVVVPSFGSELVSPDGGKYAHPEETQDNPWNRDSSGTAECLLTSTDPFSSPRSSPGRYPAQTTRSRLRTC